MWIREREREESEERENEDGKRANRMAVFILGKMIELMLLLAF